jgi:hypothetical protein
VPHEGRHQGSRRCAAPEDWSARDLRSFRKLAVHVQAHSLLQTSGNENRASLNGAHDQARPPSVGSLNAEEHALASRNLAGRHDCDSLGPGSLDLDIVGDAKRTGGFVSDCNPSDATAIRHEASGTALSN